MPRFVLDPWKGEKGWRESRPKFLAIVLVLGLAIGFYQLFSNPIFFVDTISFSGNRFVSASELAQASGVRSYNIFFVDAGQVARALEKLPEVKAAKVSAGLPNGLHAEIAERLPRFVWESRGQTYWVDDDGIAIRQRANIPGLLSLKDLEGTPVKIGERVNVEAFNAAVSLVNAWHNGPRVFEWSRAHGLAARDEHGWLIYFGTGNQMPEKLMALRVVSTQIAEAQKKIQFIDLGNGLPYYREQTAQN